MPRPLLLGAVAGLIAVLPIGAPVVWIPAALWLLGTGHTGWGIFLGAYGLLIISGSDNVIRPYFIARGAQLPFLLTILGVLGGALGLRPARHLPRPGAARRRLHAGGRVRRHARVADEERRRARCSVPALDPVAHVSVHDNDRGI